MVSIASVRVRDAPAPEDLVPELHSSISNPIVWNRRRASCLLRCRCLLSVRIESRFESVARNERRGSSSGESTLLAGRLGTAGMWLVGNSKATLGQRPTTASAGPRIVTSSVQDARRGARSKASRMVDDDAVRSQRREHSVTGTSEHTRPFRGDVAARRSFLNPVVSS